MSVIFLLFLTLIHQCFGQELHVGSCPSKNGFILYDSKKLSGKWYNIESYPTVSAETEKCRTFTFNSSGKKLDLITHYQTNRDDDVHEKVKFLTPIAGRTATFKSEVQSPATDTGHMVILDADRDFEKYMVLWNCQNYGVFHLQNVWILTRMREPSEMLQTKARKSLTIQGVNTKPLVTVFHNECKEQTQHQEEDNDQLMDLINFFLAADFQANFENEMTNLTAFTDVSKQLDKFINQAMKAMFNPSKENKTPLNKQKEPKKRQALDDIADIQEDHQDIISDIQDTRQDIAEFRHEYGLSNPATGFLAPIADNLRGMSGFSFLLGMKLLFLSNIMPPFFREGSSFIGGQLVNQGLFFGVKSMILSVLSGQNPFRAMCPCTSLDPIQCPCRIGVLMSDALFRGIRGTFDSDDDNSGEQGLNSGRIPEASSFPFDLLLSTPRAIDTAVSVLGPLLTDFASAFSPFGNNRVKRKDINAYLKQLSKSYDIEKLINKMTDDMLNPGNQTDISTSEKSDMPKVADKVMKTMHENESSSLKRFKEVKDLLDTLEKKNLTSRQKTELEKARTDVLKRLAASSPTTTSKA